jgi:glycosyltransferase involved in cell wall biosynthesis
MADILVLTPVYNDWDSLLLLLPRLDSALAAKNLSAEVLVVNDGSTLGLEESRIADLRPRAVTRVRILDLRRNSGHQRAICLGLAYLEADSECECVVVMDADGEDNPADVPRMLDALKNEGYRKMIFAHRQKRSEGCVFRLFYLLYRKLFAVLIGRNVQFGNFSAMPRAILHRVVSVSEIWNHYAIGILKARIPYEMLPTERAKRLAGASHMNFVSLVLHGLSAIAIYGDVIGVRALIVTCIMMIPVALLASTAIIIRLATNLAVPGWATYVVALALILLLQSVTLSFFFVFIILNSRNNSSFLPARDYHHFITGTRVVYDRQLTTDMMAVYEQYK